MTHFDRAYLQGKRVDFSLSNNARFGRAAAARSCYRYQSETAREVRFATMQGRNQDTAQTSKLAPEFGACSNLLSGVDRLNDRLSFG
jgi:hypothetical protein